MSLWSLLDELLAWWLAWDAKFHVARTAYFKHNSSPKQLSTMTTARGATFPELGTRLDRTRPDKWELI